VESFEARMEITGNDSDKLEIVERFQTLKRNLEVLKAKEIPIDPDDKKERFNEFQNLKNQLILLITDAKKRGESERGRTRYF
jgi:hypothetical protein